MDGLLFRTGRDVSHRFLLIIIISFRIQSMVLKISICMLAIRPTG